MTKSNQSKMLRFRAAMTIAEAARLIAQGVADGSTPAEMGLFQPASSRNKARWLRMERTLEFYELKNDDTIEYKKRMRPLKVKLEDGTVKTVLIDDSDTVAQVRVCVCVRVCACVLSLRPPRVCCAGVLFF